MRGKIRSDWRELARSCIESGMTVYAWCKANGVPYTTCKKWIARLGEEKSAVPAAGSVVWGRVETSEQADIALKNRFPVDGPAIKLNFGEWSIELKQGFDPVLLKQVMKVVEIQC